MPPEAVHPESPSPPGSGCDLRAWKPCEGGLSPRIPVAEDRRYRPPPPSAGRKRTAADRRPVGHLAGFQTVQEGGLIPIARIEHRCLGANAGLAGLVDQVQGDLARELGRLLHRLINEEQVPPGDIAILLGRRPESIGLPRQGSICAFPITNAQEPDPGRVTLETIHRFKGMEAPVVILTGLEGMFARTAETLLYVGMTGAKGHLVVLEKAEVLARWGLGGVV